MSEEKYQYFQNLAKNKPNLRLRQYTPHLLALMQKADLSISLGGYNTTMNVLKTGVRSLIYPSSKDREQAIRAEKLQQLGLLQIIDARDLEPEILAQKIVAYLSQEIRGNALRSLELEGAQKTREFLRALLGAKDRSSLMPSEVAIA